MSTYKHLLIGLDLSPESQQVVDRVKFLFFRQHRNIQLCKNFRLPYSRAASLHLRR